MTECMRILVVDDEPDLEALFRQRFRKRVREGELLFLFARNGNEALRTLEDDKEIGLVFTDINMPEMDGLTLLGRLLELGRPLRTVVVSAYGDIQNIRTAMNRGAFDFLTKPIDFEDLEVTLDKTLRELIRIREAQAAQYRLRVLDHELEAARTIQQAMLPSVFPERKDLDLYATMTPAKGVAGDFYDFFLLDPTRIGLVIADVSGKGIPAALLMALTRTLLRATGQSGADPEVCLTQVNRALCGDSEYSRFVTLFYGQADLETGELRYCNAGHNPPFVIRGHTVEEIPPVGGLVLGVNADAEYVRGSVTLGRGETLFLYTDGVTEAMTPTNAQFGEERLLRALREPAKSARELIERVERDVEAFTDGRPPSDDVTCLAFRYT